MQNYTLYSLECRKSMIQNRFWSIGMLINYFFILTSSSSCVVGADNVPTVEQFVKLYQGAMEQYQTWEVMYTANCYKVDKKNKPVGEALAEDHITWRKANNCTYGEVQRIVQNGISNKQGEVIQYMTTPEWSRKLITRQGHGNFGVIRRDKVFASIACTTVSDVLKNPFGGDILSDLVNSNGIVKQDSAHQTMIMEAHRQNFLISLEVDPTKGWVPLQGKVIDEKGNVVMQITLGDYKKTKEGFWVPFQYTQQCGDMAMVYTVKSAQVNIEIPQEKMEVKFPDNTVVDDQILNLVYRIRYDEGIQENLSTLDKFPSEALTCASQPTTKNTLPTLITDEQLKEAAKRGGIKVILPESKWLYSEYWVLVGFGIVLALAITIYLYRRAKK